MNLSHAQPLPYIAICSVMMKKKTKDEKADYTVSNQTVPTRIQMSWRIMSLRSFGQMLPTRRSRRRRWRIWRIS